MVNTLKFYIDGEWVDPVESNQQPVINPANGQEVGRVSFGTAADVDLAVAAARKAFVKFSLTKRDERIALLQKILAVYASRADELASAISQEMGAPVQLARKAQAAAGYHHISVSLEALKEFRFEEVRGNSVVLKEPLGVCGLITPWNWPINQIASKVAPAIACGCTMVLKPSEIAPINATIFAEILDEAGVPPGVFNLVNGDGPSVGAAMSAHPDIDLMSFTGSTAAGAAVARASSDSIKRVTQELGGKSPNIIVDDASLNDAVTRDVLTMMNNSGQSCNAPSRMLVPEARLDEVKALANKAVDSIVVGDPQNETTTMGPVVSERQWSKIQSLILAGIDEGCELLVGGPEKPEGLESGCFVKPTILVADSNQCTVAREEIFGPVLVILSYRDIDEAIEIANDSVYGLSAYVSASDKKCAEQIARQLRVGNVHINGQWGTEPMPFGGYKQSGNGREGGAYGFDSYLEIKAIMGSRS